MLASWTPLAHAPPGAIGAATILSDGSLLVHKEADNSTKVWYKFTPDSTGNYINGTWSTMANSPLERWSFPSVMLMDGRVMVLGGEYTGPSTSATWSNSGEIYNPVTNTWTSIANYPATQYGDVPMVLMNDGRVLAGNLTTAATNIYNPTTNSWTAGPTKLSNDRSDEETWIKAIDSNGHDIVMSYDVFSQPNAQKYDAQTNTWKAAGTTPANLATSGGSELGAGVRLPDGRVVQIGGTPKNAVWSPLTNTWTALVDTPANHGGNDAPAALLQNGHVLYAAGDTSTSFAAPTFFYDLDPINNTVTLVPNPSGMSASIAPFLCTLFELPNGQILLTDDSTSAYIYTPDGAPDDSWRPVVSGITNNNDGTFTLTGSQLNGISQGATYGDDDQMDSNYPLVRLTDANGVVSYARSFNWNSASVGANGSTSVKFTLPAGAVNGGAYKLEVSGAGISSKPIFVVFGGSNMTTAYTVRKDPGNSNNIQALAGNTAVGSFDASQFVGMQIIGTSSSETINVNADFSMPTVVKAGDGDDTISVGGQNMSPNFAATVAVDGGNGTDTVVYDDVNGGGNDSYTVANTSFSTSSLPSVSFTHSNIEAISLLANNGNDTINLPAISIPTTLNGGAASDQFNIGNGNLDANITANVSVIGGSGSDTVFYNDSGNSGNPTYTISSFAKSTQPTIAYGLLDVEGINLSAGSGNDTVNVGAAGTSVTVSGNDGNDIVNVNAGVSGLAVTVSAGSGSDSLFIVGSANSDVIGVTATATSGDAVTTFDSTLENLEVDGNGSADVITVNGTSASTSLVVDGGASNDSISLLTAGSNTVTIVDSVGGDNLSINTNNSGSSFGTLSGNSNPLGSVSIGVGGTMTFSSGAISTAGLTMSGGTLTGASDVTVTSAMNWSGGVMTGAGAMIISTGATMTDSTPGTSRMARALVMNGTGQLTSGGSRLLVLSSLSFGASGKLDLSDNDMILDYTGSPQYSTIAGEIASMRNTGLWDGTSGLWTSFHSGTTTLGAMEATDYKGIYGAGAQFDSEPIDNTAVLVKYTYYGDANFNGKVDGGDYSRTDFTFGQEASLGNIGGWINGDFNYDNKVNGGDYGLIDFAFAGQGMPLRPPGAGASPNDLTLPGHGATGAGKGATGSAKR